APDFGGRVVEYFGFGHSSPLSKKGTGPLVAPARTTCVTNRGALSAFRTAAACGAGFQPADLASVGNRPHAQGAGPGGDACSKDKSAWCHRAWPGVVRLSIKGGH